MDTPNPLELFEAVRGYDPFKKPELEDVAGFVFGGKLDPVPEQLGRKTGVINVQAVGNGEQLGITFGGLLVEATQTVVKLDTPEHWEAHQPELFRLFSTFFNEAGHNPAVFWVFAVSWTDRAVAHLTSRVEFRSEPISYPRQFGARVPLRFRNRELPAGPYPPVSVNTREIQWLCPERVLPEHPPLVKLVEPRRTYGKFTVSHRELLGVAENTGDDWEYLGQALYPGLRGKVYSLWRPEDHPDGLLVTHYDSEARTRGKGAKGPVDSMGILDVYELKGWRLFKDDFGVLETEELSVAVDVLGRVAFISTTSESYGYLDNRLEELAVGQWLDRHMP